MTLRTSSLLATALGAALACGGESAPAGGGTTTTAPPAPLNVQPIVVTPGVTGDYVDGVFTSVTVCAPGTSNCQTIDDVLVDTGSAGLRLVSSGAAGGRLSIALPQQNGSDGNPVVECAQFVDGFTWGPVRTADVALAGERATAVPIQVVGDPAFATVATGCTNTGLPSESTVATLSANGILGIGPWRQDCGAACTTSASAGLYYTCAQGNCQPAVESLAAQVQNPVWMFPADNNGVLLQLPAVPASGAASAAGSLIFGIGTQANNSLGSATVLGLDPSGNFTTVFGDASYPQSFVDSGSNGYFFPSSGTNLPVCADSSDFYCPAQTQSFTATNTGAQQSGVPVQSKSTAFRIADADALSGSAFAFDDLGGPNSGSFDWGLPLFFGRNVFTAIEQQSTPAGPGPYVAY